MGSPSTNTELTLDVIEANTHSRLVGALVGFTWRQAEPLQQDNEATTAVLGQITSLEMRNRWHEDQTFKNIIKSHQTLPSITPAQDTRTALMKVGGCFVRNPDGESYTHGDMGSVPSTGTTVNLVQQRFLDSVLAFCRQDLFHLGNAYGNDVAFPMWFKHFGPGSHGVGEAYHVGIFGKTGSGKTGLAKMLLTAYARHPSMGILVIDPQGEFSLEMSGKQIGGQQLDILQIMRDRLGREVIQLQISKLRLNDWELFRELVLGSKIFELALGIRGETQRLAAEAVLMRFLQSKFRIGQFATENCARLILAQLKRQAGEIYNGTATRNQLKGKIDRLLDDEFRTFYDRYWYPLANLFADGEGKRGLDDVINQLTHGKRGIKPIVVVDLSDQSGTQLWSDTLQKRVISHLANSLIAESSKTLATGNTTANTLVVLDEAHRFVPSGGDFRLSPEDETLRMELKRAVRETRKYGVGWMFISQTMQGVDTEILTQLRAMFFGYGLSFGLEFRRLRELAGGDDDAMRLYTSFRDPQSAIDASSKRFPFMAIGPISPMPFSGQPMFFSAFNASDFEAENDWEGYSD